VPDGFWQANDSNETVKRSRMTNPLLKLILL